jgi:cytochrome oxidase Cu insertion factor (SCO1/SenC/PrrC family)
VIRTARRIGVALVALVVVLALVTPFAFAGERKELPAVGEPAPELKLGDQNGKVFVLADTLKDKEFVVLAFYPKAFTGG